MPEKRNEKKRKSWGGRGKNPPQREKGGTAREKRRD